MSYSLMSADIDANVSLTLTRAISFKPNDIVTSAHRLSFGDVDDTDAGKNTTLNQSCNQSFDQSFEVECSEDDVIDFEAEEDQFDQQNIQLTAESISFANSHPVLDPSISIPISQCDSHEYVLTHIQSVQQSKAQSKRPHIVTYDSLSDLAKNSKLGRMHSHSSASSSTSSQSLSPVATATLVAHPSLSQTFQAVISPIIANPITRLNQDDVITGIAPLHIDLDTGKVERVRETSLNRSTSINQSSSINQPHLGDVFHLPNAENLQAIWYEDDLSEDYGPSHSQSSSEDEASFQFDREVSGITSRSVSINQSFTAHPAMSFPTKSVSSTHSVNRSINRSISQANPVQSAIRASDVAAEFSYGVSQVNLLSKPSCDQSVNQLVNCSVDVDCSVKVLDDSRASSSACVERLADCDDIVQSINHATLYLCSVKFLSLFVSVSSYLLTLLSLMQIVNDNNQSDAQSMLAASLFGIGDSTSRVLSIPIIRWMQRKTNMRMVDRPIDESISQSTFTLSVFFGVIIEHMLVVVCMFLLYLMSIDQQYRQSSNQTFMLIGVVCAGALIRFGGTLVNQSIYQDWSRALFNQAINQSTNQSINQHFSVDENEQNFVDRLRRFDLIAAVFGYVSVAILLCTLSQSTTLIVAGCFSGLALIIVLLLLIGANRCLHVIQRVHSSMTHEKSHSISKQSVVSPFRRPLSQSNAHLSLLPGLAHALLSLSILSFTTGMIVYLSSLHVGISVIVLGVALQTVVFVFPWFLSDHLNRLIARNQLMSAELASATFVWLQCVMLAPIVSLFCLVDDQSSDSFVLPLFICLLLSALCSGCFNGLEHAINVKDGEPSIHLFHSLNVLNDDSQPRLIRYLIGICVIGSCALTAIFSQSALIFLPVLISFGSTIIAAIILTVHARRSPVYQSIKQSIKAAESEMTVLQNLGTGSEEPDLTHKMEDELLQI